MSNMVESGLKYIGGKIEKRLPKYWKPIGVLLVAGAVITGAVSAEHVQDNDKKVSAAGGEAMGLALGRGACKLTSAKETVVKGKHLLTLGMELDSRFDPKNIEDKQFGGAFMGVAFHDNSDKYGIAINRITEAKTPAKHVAQPKPPVKQTIVKGTNSSFEGTDTVIVPAPTNLNAQTYEVSRFVVVTSEATGRLVHDTTVDAVAQIFCGTFIDYPGMQQPVVQ